MDEFVIPHEEGIAVYINSVGDITIRIGTPERPRDLISIPFQHAEAIGLRLLALANVPISVDGR